MVEHFPQSTEQGSFFKDELVSNGAPDPELHETKHNLEPVPGGVFSEKIEPIAAPSFEDPNLAKVVHEAVVSDQRRKSQTGKHSPLERDGSYKNIRVGDFLPGFGPVTYRNLAQAQEKADQLEQARTGQ